MFGGGLGGGWLRGRGRGRVFWRRVRGVGVLEVGTGAGAGCWVGSWRGVLYLRSVVRGGYEGWEGDDVFVVVEGEDEED